MRRSGPIYAFGDFRLDAARRRLSTRIGGQSVALSAIAFDLLLHLVERAGEVVSRAALLEAAWPGLNVVENSVNQAVVALRRALGDDPASPRYVVTVPGRGYRFAAAVTADNDAERDPEAYRNYVAGWLGLTRPGLDTLDKALELLEAAVARDPAFALAHACIAECHVFMVIHAGAPPEASLAQARAAAARALDIDPHLAEAHAVQAAISMMADLDVISARRSLEHALELDEHCFLAHRYMGLTLLQAGQPEAALGYLRRALALEPLAVHVNGNVGMAYYFAGRYADAVAQFEHTLRMEERFASARMFLGFALSALGEHDRAMAELTRLREERPGPLFGFHLAVAQARAGLTDAARAGLAKLVNSPEISQVGSYEIASVYAALGDDEAAIDWLERAEAGLNLPFVTVDPVFNTLRDHPRFEAIIRRTWIPENA